MDKLEAIYRRNRAEILRVGKTFGVVTRETSLIVLDRVSDYARFEIVPPAELRGEYDRLLAASQQLKMNERTSQLERVVKLFEQRQAWWQRDFPKGGRPAPAARKVTAGPGGEARAERDDSARRESAAPAASAAPRSAPAPVAAMARPAADARAPVVANE